MPSAADQVAAAIHAAGGAIPFSEFMNISLYGENGFYSVAGRAGRRGDFITSPEVGPLFGTILASALDAWWRELGEPDEFTVVDAGAGPGTLARSIFAAAPRCSNALRYVAVEASAAQRGMQPSDVESRSSMPSGLIIGVVLANELLDNLPFRLFVFDGTWQEAYVAIGSDSGSGEAVSFVEVLRTPQSLPDCLPLLAPHGARIPVQSQAAQWVVDTLRLIERGRLVVFDYCTPTTGELANRPWREWLRTFRRHERGGHYLQSVGEQDITAQVVIDQLPASTSVTTQANFLRQWNVDALVGEGRESWSRHSGAPDLAAMKMRSRISEAEALLDPKGLGSFATLQWVK